MSSTQLAFASNRLWWQPWRLPVLVAALILALAAGALGPVQASSEALAPEVPRGAWLLVSSLSVPLAAGDVVIAERVGRQWMGRVRHVDREARRVVVMRRNEPDRTFKLAEISGWVVLVLN